MQDFFVWINAIQFAVKVQHFRLSSLVLSEFLDDEEVAVLAYALHAVGVKVNIWRYWYNLFFIFKKKLYLSKYIYMSVENIL